MTRRRNEKIKNIGTSVRKEVNIMETEGTDPSRMGKKSTLIKEETLRKSQYVRIKEKEKT